MQHGTYLGWSYRMTVVTNGNVRGCIFLFFALNFLVNIYASQHNTTHQEQKRNSTVRYVRHEIRQHMQPFPNLPGAS
jgi:hypothetical protein